MEIITIDDDVCSESKNEITQYKMKRYEKIEENYKNISNVYAENEIKSLKKVSKACLSSSLEFIRNSKIFMQDMLNFFNVTLQNWQNYLTNIEKAQSKTVSFKIPNSEWFTCGTNLTKKNANFLVLCTDAQMMIENSCQSLKKLKKGLKDRKKNLQSHKGTNFQFICFWLAEYQYQKSLTLLKVKLISFKKNLKTISDLLNDLELAKIACINNFFSDLNSFFTLPMSFTENCEVSLGILDFSHELLSNSHLFSINLSEDLISVKGGLFLRSGEHNQWKKFLAYCTLDGYLHIFSDPLQIFPETSLDLNHSQMRFTFEDDEYHLKISSNVLSTDFRIGSNSEYIKWKRILLI